MYFGDGAWALRVGDRHTVGKSGMDLTDLEIDDQPDDADVRFLDQQINDFNFAVTGVTDGRLLALFLRDAQGSIIAGLYGWTWGGCLEIKYLWVAEAWRGRGHGTRLLAAAEGEAIARGCTQAMLDTHSFQAPLFYQRAGYTIFGVMDNYPTGHAKCYLKKQLR
jgi:GNAT superfamily N-acetyltransferase